MEKIGFGCKNRRTINGSWQVTAMESLASLRALCWAQDLALLNVGHRQDATGLSRLFVFFSFYLLLIFK